MRIRSSASFGRRLRDLAWRLREGDWERPPLFEPAWMPADAAQRLEALVAARPLVVIDLGSRGGIRYLRELRSLTRLYGFEPNEPERAPLEAEWHTDGYLEARFLPAAAWSTTGTGTLNVTRFAGTSSFLEPDLEALGAFGFAEAAEVVDRRTVATIALDDLADQERLEYADVVKIDVQGGELEVLRGAERLLPHVSLVRTEVLFRPLYHGAPLFRDIDAELARHGFALLAVDNATYPVSVRTRSSVPDDVGDRGEWLWADAVFVNDRPAREQALAGDPAAAVRLVLVLESFGFVGYALDLIAALEHAPGGASLGALRDAILKRHRFRAYERRPSGSGLLRRMTRRLARREPYPPELQQRHRPRQPPVSPL